jgi:PadR family transcriptional regulator PadR
MARMTVLQFELLTALGRGRRHGYALMNELEKTMPKRPGVATVYAALEKLQGAQWVVPDGEQVVDGRVRRYWVLTDAGAAALTTEADEFARRAAAAKTSLRLRGTEEALA